MELLEHTISPLKERVADASLVTITVTAIVVLDGELDCSTEREITRRIARLAESSDVVHIDARQVAFIDAAGVRTLLLAKRDALANGATIDVQIASQSAVERMLQITGLTGRFDAPGAVDTADHASGNGRHG